MIALDKIKQRLQELQADGRNIEKIKKLKKLQLCIIQSIDRAEELISDYTAQMTVKTEMLSDLKNVEMLIDESKKDIEYLTVDKMKEMNELYKKYKR